MSKQPLPWTVKAFYAYLEGGRVPNYTLDAHAAHPAVIGDLHPIHHTADRRPGETHWARWEHILNPALAHHFLNYASVHGHAIPKDVLRGWELEWLRQDFASEVMKAIADAQHAERIQPAHDSVQGFLQSYLARRLEAMPLIPIRPMEVSK